MAVLETRGRGQLQRSFRGEGDSGLCIRGVLTFVASFSGDGNSLLKCNDCEMLNACETVFVLSPFMEMEAALLSMMHLSCLT